MTGNKALHTHNGEGTEDRPEGGERHHKARYPDDRQNIRAENFYRLSV